MRAQAIERYAFINHKPSCVNQRRPHQRPVARWEEKSFRHPLVRGPPPHPWGIPFGCEQTTSCLRICFLKLIANACRPLFSAAIGIML